MSLPRGKQKIFSHLSIDSPSSHVYTNYMEDIDMPLYHADVFLPSNLTLPRGLYGLNYGPHAMREAENEVRKFGRFGLPTTINTSKARVVEVETDERGETRKIVYRTQLDIDRDLCIVVIPERRRWFVKTVWINLRSDTHTTLRTERYATA